MWLEIHQLCINKSTNGGRNERWKWEGGGASKESKKRTMEMDCRRYRVGLWCCIRAELDGPTWLFHVWIKSTRLWPMLHSVDSAYVQNWQSRFSSSWTAEGFLADSSLGTREAHSLYAKRSHFHYLPLTLEIGTYGSPLTYTCGYDQVHAVLQPPSALIHRYLLCISKSKLSSWLFPPTPTPLLC